MRKLFIKCPTCNIDVNHTATVVKDDLARGISEPDIQHEHLGDKTQYMTLVGVSQFSKPKS